MAKKVTAKNLPTVWFNLTKYVADCVDDAQACALFCKDLNDFLDELASQDAFGTEGQCDPRGEQR